VLIDTLISARLAHWQVRRREVAPQEHRHRLELFASATFGEANLASWIIMLISAKPSFRNGFPDKSVLAPYTATAATQCSEAM